MRLLFQVEEEQKKLNQNEGIIELKTIVLCMPIHMACVKLSCMIYRFINLFYILEGAGKESFNARLIVGIIVGSVTLTAVLTTVIFVMILMMSTSENKKPKPAERKIIRGNHRGGSEEPTRQHSQDVCVTVEMKTNVAYLTAQQVPTQDNIAYGQNSLEISLEGNVAYNTVSPNSHTVLAHSNQQEYDLDEHYYY